MNPYLASLVAKYNADPKDPSISYFERQALDKIKNTEIEVSDLNQQIRVLMDEINERNTKIMELNNKIATERGKNNALVDMIVTMAQGG